MKRNLFLVFLLLAFTAHLHAITVNNPVDYVSTLVGQPQNQNFQRVTPTPLLPYHGV